MSQEYYDAVPLVELLIVITSVQLDIYFCIKGKILVFSSGDSAVLSKFLLPLEQEWDFHLNVPFYLFTSKIVI